MKKLTKILICLAALCLLLAIPATTQAGTSTANLSVSVEVDSACTLTTTPLVFAVYSPLSASADNSTGAVVMTCTTGTIATIDLDAGAHAVLLQRKLMSGASGTLSYNLYQDASRSQVWSTGANTLSTTAAPDTSPRSYTVYGQIPAQQGAASGSYTDTVVATVNF
jgi:spore coat protein U-like protein